MYCFKSFNYGYNLIFIYIYIVFSIFTQSQVHFLEEFGCLELCDGLVFVGRS